MTRCNKSEEEPISVQCLPLCPRFQYRNSTANAKIYVSCAARHLDTDLARVSPLCRAHIIPTGTYSFEPELPGVDLAHNTLP
jgi:hypothetical protein